MRDIILSQHQTITVLTETVERMRGELSSLKRMLFGQRRERLPKGKMPTVGKALRERTKDDEATKLERRPLAKRILELVVQSDIVNADETPLFVQAPEHCRRGFMWTFLANKLIAYQFSPTRSGETPKNVLADTAGMLQVDGYSGYNHVCAPKGRKRVGCLAHARRKFFNALTSAPQDAQTALEHILSLYEVEYEAARRGVLGASEHAAMRVAVTMERIATFREWMKERQGVWTPKSPMGEALRYGLKTLATLEAAIEDPRVRLDNNLAEGALRLIALGRKNYLFVGDDEAGKNLAVLQTLVSTCLANDVNPEVKCSS